MTLDPRDGDMLEVARLLPFVEEYGRGADYEAGYRAGRRIRRGTLLAIAFTSAALVLAAFQAGRVLAAPSPAPQPLLDRPARDLSELATLQPAVEPSGALPAQHTTRPSLGTSGKRARATVVPRTAPTLRGTASYFPSPGYTAAVHSFRWGDRRYALHVTGPVGTTTVTVVSYCDCYAGTRRERLVDLSPAAFEAVCGPLWKGLCTVLMG